MGFKEVQDLDCDTTMSLGGFNKKTGTKNATSIEGYYLGSKETPSKKAKNGIAMLHILLTSKGNIGVWGKTDLDRKISAVTPGHMIRITQNGSVPTPNGDMYKFKVEVDSDNTTEVSLPLQNSKAVAAEEGYVVRKENNPSYPDEAEEVDAYDDEPALDEVQPVRAARPATRATVPSQAKQNELKALLSRGSK